MSFEYKSAGVINKATKVVSGNFAATTSDNHLTTSGVSTIDLPPASEFNVGFTLSIATTTTDLVSIKPGAGDAINSENELIVSKPGFAILRISEQGEWVAGFIENVGVPIASSTAYVNKSGNDTTGRVGDRSKPFLTVQAAANAIPFIGAITVEDGIFAGIGQVIDFQDKFVTITLHNATIGNELISVNGGLYIQGIGPRFGSFANARSQVTGKINTKNLIMTNLLWNGAELTSGTLSEGLFQNCRISSDLETTFALNDTTGFSIAEFWNCDFFNRDLPLVDGTNKDTYTLWTFYNCNFLTVNTGLFAGLNNNFLLRFHLACKMIVDNDVFAGVSTGTSQFGTDLDIDISNCDITSNNGYIMNLSGADTMNLKALNSNIVSGQAENINWAANPANVVNLQSASNSKRPWNSFGVVNQIVNGDLIDSNIT